MKIKKILLTFLIISIGYFFSFSQSYKTSLSISYPCLKLSSQKISYSANFQKKIIYNLYFGLNYNYTNIDIEKQSHLLTYDSKINSLSFLSNYSFKIYRKLYFSQVFSFGYYFTKYKLNEFENPTQRINNFCFIIQPSLVFKTCKIIDIIIFYNYNYFFGKIKTNLNFPIPTSYFLTKPKLTHNTVGFSFTFNF